VTLKWQGYLLSYLLVQTVELQKLVVREGLVDLVINVISSLKIKTVKD
jgi:hypothetical protein